MTGKCQIDPDDDDGHGDDDHGNHGDHVDHGNYDASYGVDERPGLLVL